MTDVQKELIELLKEVDDICRKYGIEYYLGGGCLIGAVRHGCFLPWDDDVDIHMSRENLCKFLDAVEKEKPANRMIQWPTIGNNMNAHWRYKRTDNTYLMRSNIGTDAVEGQFVDIFVTYPMPLNPAKRDRCVSDFKLFLELNAKNVILDSLRDTSYLRQYYAARACAKLLGTDRVIHYLEKRIFNFPQEGASEWLIRSPLPPKFVVPKEWWGKPRYVDFETMQFPIPEFAEKILCHEYGPCWFEVPNYEERGKHVFGIDLDLPYTLYTSDYEKHINVEEFYQHQVKKKEYWFKLLWNRNIVMPHIRKLQGLSVSLEIQEKVEKNGIDLKSMVEQEEEEELKQLFAPYFLKIQSEPYRYYGVYVDMPDDYLYAAFYFQCFNGSYGMARKVLGLRRKEESRELSPELQRLCALCDATDELLALLYGDFNMAEARTQVDKWLEKEPNALYFLRADLYLRLNGYGSESTKELLQRTDRYLERYPGDAELLKYRGDLLIRSGEILDGEKCYYRALCGLRNGFCIKSIKEYFAAKDLGAAR